MVIWLLETDPMLRGWAVEKFLSFNITIFQTLGSGLLPTKDQYQNIKYAFPFVVSLLQFCKLIDTSSSAYIVVYGV